MNQATTIVVRVNGEPRSLAGPTTVAQLLEALGHAGRRVAVERNGEIVPRGRHASTPLEPDDQIEIVVAVGGG
jgi:sulfur carrier protein